MVANRQLPQSLWRRVFSPGRFSRYVRGLTASYGSLGVGLLFTAVTVPLGISTMGLESWGVWIFCQQASLVICLFESFTQSAFIRLLIQVKDDSGSEDYKRMVVMGRFCFWAQGLLLVACHAAFAALLPRLFPNFTGPTGFMTIWILGMAGFVNQVGKINGQLLYAHQHQDRASLAATVGLLFNLLLVVVCLPRFPQPQTMAWAVLAASIPSQILYWLFARHAGCQPTCPTFPKMRWHDFRPLWFWGRRFFFYSLLDNFSTSLPTLLAGRFLSLEMVGVWGVLQRIYNLMSQAVSKIFQLAVPALMEMHARSEEFQFGKRSDQILWIQNSLAGLGLGIFAASGQDLLRLWLGKSMPLDVWVLPIFSLALLADFDQRARFGLETCRLQMNRPTLAVFLKVVLLLLLTPALSRWYGLQGMALGLWIVFALVLLPLSLLKTLLPNSYSLPGRATIVGLATFTIGVGMGWWGRGFLA